MSALRKTIVTGCNKGIGKAIVQNLASKGHSSTIMACRNPLAAQATMKQIIQKFPGASLQIAELDLASTQSIHGFTQNIGNKNQKIDVLINNAGITCPLGTKSLEQVQKLLQTNFYNTILFTESLLQKMNNNSKILLAGGFIGKLSQLTNIQLKSRFKNENLSKNDLVNLIKQFEQDFKSGEYSKKGWPKWPYALSKLAINHYAKILAKDQTVIKKNIQVYAYCPGYVKTDMTGNKGKLTVSEGAITPVFLAELDSSQYKHEQNGGFFQKCKISSLQ